MIRLVALLALLLPVQAAASCRQVTFEATPFTLCEARAGDDLRLFLRDGSGAILGDFTAVEASLPPGTRLSFAMNAGMYHDDRRPVGLYIEGDRHEGVLSDGGGYGNFGLLPNGVFCISDRLRVWEREAFIAAAPDCRYATQSGPMLVIGGALHPAFHANSTSRAFRNGVGTSADGSRAVFAISDRPVNFHLFARFFRDYLGLADALYFDGNVSRLYAPDLGRADGGAPMGPIVGLVERSDPVD
ncbi:MAG TPA: hypothetical protein ENK45_01165 [Aliiroseovarius sp.]|nr:hypothetical protein [Aliiroseovarius sp.]